MRQKPSSSSTTKCPPKLGTWAILPWDAEVSILSFLSYTSIVQLSMASKTMYDRQHFFHMPKEIKLARKHVMSFFNPRLTPPPLTTLTLMPSRGNYPDSLPQVQVAMKRMKYFEVLGNQSATASRGLYDDLVTGLPALPRLFPNLMTLNLSNSFMGVLGITKLADGIISNQGWPSLARLELSSNLMSDEVRGRLPHA